MSNAKEKIKNVYSKREAYLVSRYARTYGIDGIAIELMLDYGMRKGEVLALHKNDINFEKNYLTVNHSVSESKDKNTGKVTIKLVPPKNKTSNRIIPLSKHTISRLSLFHDGLLFPNSKGGLMSPKNWTDRNYKRFMKSMQEYYSKINIPALSPHELRHTRATIWINSGKNPYAVASVLGHADLKMFQQRYAHKDMESIRNMLDI